MNSTWKYIKLSEIAKGIRGVSYKPWMLKNAYDNDIVILLRSNNIKDGNLNLKDVQFVPIDILNDNQFCEPDDIIMCMSNGSRHLVGKNAYVKKEWKNLRITSGAFCSIFKAVNKSDKKFLFYLFQSQFFQKQLDVTLSGSAINNLQNSQVEQFRFNVPINPVEQQKIAKILFTTDAVIEKTQAAIAKYKAIKQGMLNDLFTRGIDIKTGKLRPKQEDAPELYKESELGWIPKEWFDGKFIDFADKNIHHSFTGGPFGSDLQTKHYTNSGVRIIQLQNIGDGVFNDDYKIYTSEERANYLINCNIYHGEIIISKMADPIARACIIPRTEKRYLMASDGIRLSIDKKTFNSRFVMETINHKRFRNIAELKATGSTRARIGLTELREIAVAYPEKVEQDAIGSRLDTIENKLQTENDYLLKLQQIKSGLMADLLSGKKLVTVASDKETQTN